MTAGRQMKVEHISSATREVVACPVCNISSADTWLEEGKGTKYVKCRVCHTVYASPRSSWQVRSQWLTKTFDLDATAFGNASQRRSSLRKEARIIQQQVKKGRLCDVGCGIGDLFAFFDREKFECYGVELSPGAARFAAEKHHARVHAGTLTEANLPTSFFDVVTSLDTFYYVDDPRLELQELCRILKPGGLLVIELPGQKYQLLRSVGFLPRMLNRGANRVSSDSPYLYWFPASALKKMLSTMGFSLISARVVPSPDTGSLVMQTFTRFHYALARVLAPVSHVVLDYSPKYLCFFRCDKQVDRGNS
jgi:SAM-dependent methyltransferase